MRLPTSDLQLPSVAPLPIGSPEVRSDTYRIRSLLFWMYLKLSTSVARASQPYLHAWSSTYASIRSIVVSSSALITVTVTLTTFAYTKVIPAKAGIQEIMQFQPQLDPRLRGGDGGAVTVTMTKV
jgi:hypothetical protein